MNDRRRGLEWFWLIAVLGACRTPEGEATGDEVRSAAIEIVPGSIVDDKVAARGDPVDFKRFQVGPLTPCTINVYWDNPAIDAHLSLRDQFGGLVAELAHANGAPKDTIGPIPLKDGTFFLEITAKKGASVYSVELFLGDPETMGSEAVPWPE